MIRGLRSGFLLYSSNPPIPIGFLTIPLAVPVFSAAEVEHFQIHGFVIARGLVPQPSCEAMKALALRQLAAATQPVEYEAQVK